MSIRMLFLRLRYPIPKPNSWQPSTQKILMRCRLLGVLRFRREAYTLPGKLGNAGGSRTAWRAVRRPLIELSNCRDSTHQNADTIKSRNKLVKIHKQDVSPYSEAAQVSKPGCATGHRAGQEQTVDSTVPCHGFHRMSGKKNLLGKKWVAPWWFPISSKSTPEIRGSLRKSGRKEGQVASGYYKPLVTIFLPRSL